jgi:hypothetical protein
MGLSQPDSLQLWRDSRQQLDYAIQHYLETTLVLRTSICDHSIDQSFLKNAIHEISNDLNNLSARTDSLKKSQAILSQIRNRSTFLVPINRLPPEVLLLVFRFSTWKGSCGRFDPSMPRFDQHHLPKSLFTLTHVCTDWRSILLHNPSFWSHVKLEHEGTRRLVDSCSRLQVSLQRAQTLPLCFELDCRPLDDWSMTMIINCLHPYLENLRSLKLSNVVDYEILYSFITFWLTRGQAGSVQSLLIWGKGITRRSCRLDLINSALSQQHIDSFLRPVRVLRLNGVHFPWDSPIYCGLVMLHVGSLDTTISPTLGDMLGILSACPQLQILQLYNMSILASDQNSLQPITLPELKVLDMSRLDSEGLHLLLPMIFPQSDELSVQVDLYASNSVTCPVVQSFLARTNVTRLYISHPHGTDGITEYLSATQHLHTLILDLGSRSGDASLEAITHPSESNVERTPLCPKLHTMYLIKGSLGHQTVWEAVKAHPLMKKLIFASCTLEPSDEDEELVLRSQLKSVVKDVTYDLKLDGGMSTYWYILMS